MPPQFLSSCCSCCFPLSDLWLLLLSTALYVAPFPATPVKRHAYQHIASSECQATDNKRHLIYFITGVIQSQFRGRTIRSTTRKRGGRASDRKDWNTHYLVHRRKFRVGWFAEFRALKSFYTDNNRSIIVSVKSRCAIAGAKRSSANAKQRIVTFN